MSKPERKTNPFRFFLLRVAAIQKFHLLRTISSPQKPLLLHYNSFGIKAKSRNYHTAMTNNRGDITGVSGAPNTNTDLQFGTLAKFGAYEQGLTVALALTSGGAGQLEIGNISISAGASGTDKIKAYRLTILKPDGTEHATINNASTLNAAVPYDVNTDYTSLATGTYTVKGFVWLEDQSGFPYKQAKKSISVTQAVA